MVASPFETMRWSRAGRVDEIVVYARAHIAGLLEVGESPAPIRASFLGEPASLGAMFPVQVTAEATGRGQGNTSRGKPAEIGFSVRFYDLVVGTPDQPDGQQRAEDSTMQAYGLLVEAMESDRMLKSKVQDWEISLFESAPLTDRIGRPLTVQGNILWRLMGDLRLVL